MDKQGQAMALHVTWMFLPFTFRGQRLSKRERRKRRDRGDLELGLYWRVRSLAIGVLRA
jgi:hypothetical protein